MNAKLAGDHGQADRVLEEDEIDIEELDRVVGGLDGGWWPEADDASGPPLVIP